MGEADPSKKVADRYLKREVLGEGTYGVVYKAIDTKVGEGHLVFVFHYSSKVTRVMSLCRLDRRWR